MYLEKFPDITWLRIQSRKNFQDGRDIQGNALPHSGWPNVILHTQSTHVERDNILGPFSIFWNISGGSKIRVDSKWYPVNENVYCLSNKGQSYDLHIPKNEKAETFNIHFGERLYHDVVASMMQKHCAQLDNALTENRISLDLLPKTEWKSPALKRKLNYLQRFCRTAKNDYSLEHEYELLSYLLAFLLTEAVNKLIKTERISALKSATRVELLRRISIAVDYCHENTFSEISLDELSQICGLSKFHLLRVFKEVYGITPRKYAAHLRLTKAKELLTTKTLSLSEIAHSLGFSELSAFTRFFKHQMQESPGQYRLHN